MSRVLRLAACLMTAAPTASFAAAEPPDFTQEVAPILEQRCTHCHGPKQQVSGLRLDSREAMLQGGQRGPSVLPGDAANSRLYRHIAGVAEPRMPFGSTLSPDEIATLRRWIDAGAHWEAEQAQQDESWWAFAGPARYDPPDSAAHPIDAFLVTRLEEKGLLQARRADPRTLVRSSLSRPDRSLAGAGGG